MAKKINIYAILGFVHEREFETAHKFLIESFEGEAVKEQRNVAHGVNMTIRVEVAIFETITIYRVSGYESRM